MDHICETWYDLLHINVIVTNCDFEGLNIGVVGILCEKDSQNYDNWLTKKP